MHETAVRLLAEYATVPPKVTQSLTYQIWTATQFLSGSTTRQIPYEAVFGLRQALEGWNENPVTISTALIQDSNFYLKSVDPEFYQLTEAYFGIKFEQELVQIALPQIYRHKPLYNVALYHELGHFVDLHRGVTDHTLLTHDAQTSHILPGISARPTGMSESDYELLQIKHRREFFADLFAASYVGTSIKIFLEAFAADNAISFSHPATYDRLQVLQAFMSGTPNVIVDLFRSTLDTLGLAKLEKHYAPPDIGPFFDNIRPYELKSVEEVHGIFESAYHFLDDAEKRNRAPWDSMEEEQIERIVNDLVEKSTRNWMIKERWKSGAS